MPSGRRLLARPPIKTGMAQFCPFLCFFCFLFEYLLVVSIVHFLESSMTGVLPSKRRKIFGEAMWKFSKFVFLAWLLKILIRVWTGFGELKQVDRSYPVCLFDSKFDRVLAKTSPLGVVVSYWSLQFGRGSVTLGSSEFFVSTSLQPFCCGDVMCCDVMCDAVMGCHTGRWRCGEQGPHTGHYCRHRKNTVAHMPDSWSSRLWYAPFGAIPLFRRFSLFLSVWYSYSKFIHFFWCGSARLLTWNFPSLRFIPNRFHGLSKWTEVSYNHLVCMGVAWVSEPEYHFHSVLKMLSNQSPPHVYFLKSWSMQIIITKRVPLFLPGHCPSKTKSHSCHPDSPTAILGLNIQDMFFPWIWSSLKINCWGLSALVEEVQDLRGNKGVLDL